MTELLGSRVLLLNSGKLFAFGNDENVWTKGESDIMLSAKRALAVPGDESHDLDYCRSPDAIRPSGWLGADQRVRLIDTLRAA